MSTQLAVRLSDADLDGLDALVLAGIDRTRVGIIRQAVERFISQERRRLMIEADIESWERHPETTEDMERAGRAAIAACEAEDWSAVYPARL